MQDDRLAKHWEGVYASQEAESLGWFEPQPGPSLDLIDQCGIGLNEAIVDVGSGETRLLGDLLDRGYANLTAVDISQTALEKAAQQLGARRSAMVHWIVDDLTAPKRLLERGPFRLWHDRAALHFLVHEDDRLAYADLLRTTLDRDGWVVIGAFSKSGARMCSGLPVLNQDAAMILELLGKEFELVEEVEHLHATPSGDDRPYVYVRLKRIGFRRPDQ